MQLLDPEVVVVGGGVAHAGEALLAPLRAAVRRYALESHWRGLRIVRAELGGGRGRWGRGWRPGTCPGGAAPAGDAAQAGSP